MAVVQSPIGPNLNFPPLSHMYMRICITYVYAYTRICGEIFSNNRLVYINFNVIGSIPFLKSVDQNVRVLDRGVVPPKGGTAHLLPKNNIFYALSQNNQQLFEK